MNNSTGKQREIIESLAKKFSSVHQVLFARIVERANDETELFDILDTMPDSFPMMWDSDKRRLLPAKDMLNR